jgi:hypothetical protein
MLPGGEATDEALLAGLTGVPAGVLVAPQVVAAGLAMTWAWRLSTRRGDTRALVLALGSACVGGALHVFVVGPALV